MAARPISVNRFAEEVEARLIDTHAVAELLGLRQKQTVYNWVEAVKIPAPILKLEKGYAFWDRYAILNARPTRR